MIEKLSYREAINRLYNIFHKTRLTHNVSVPPEIVSAILDGPTTRDV